MRKALLKKLMAMGLAASMLFVVAGCGSDADESASKENSKVEESKTEGNSSETDAVPEKEDPITLKWIMLGDETSATQGAIDAANELLLERYNLQLDVQVVSAGNYNDKMNMIINAGEEWDLSFSSASWLNRYLEQIGKDAFLDITEYVEENPNLTAHMPEYIVDSCRVNGRIYALPNYQISASTNGFVIRKDIIDEMADAGIDFDYTKATYNDDLIPLYEFVLENHPELYPADINMAREVQDYHHQETDWVNISGSSAYAANAIYARPEGDGWKLFALGLEFTAEEQLENKKGPYYVGTVVRDYWEKGYIREDQPTVTNESAEEAANRFAVDGLVTSPGLEGTLLRQRGMEYVMVTNVRPVASLMVGRSAMTAINANSENPDAAVKMLEIINTDAEILNLLIFGEEGVNYTMEDGKVAQIEGMGTGIQAWAIGNQCNALVSVGQDEDVWEQTDKINRDAEPNPLMGFAIDSTSVQEAVAAVGTVMGEYKNWEYEDDYKERYEEMIEKIREPLTVTVEEYQKQLDAWLSTQK